MSKEKKNEIIDWLLDSDPTIRWQVKKDLLDIKQEEYQLDRKEISKKGWGKQILMKQDPNGTWAKGLYSPKWTSTTYTLVQLRRMGLDPENTQAQKGVRVLLDKGKCTDGGINLFNSRKTSETCVTSLIFGILCYFNIEEDYLTKIFDYIRANQMKDGGWNCLLEEGAAHASMHTTLMALEALHEYKQLPDSPVVEIEVLQNKGREFLLQHKLFKSHKTGTIIDQKFLNIVFPPRWKYNILTALDYFQSEKHEYDKRFEDAVKIVIKKEKKGKWLRGSKHTGKIWFDMEEGKEPSKWNTLRALRVLKWWENISN
ncbi:MAG: hypothetical protein ACW981_07630 [Candidatus Hodarchaeales archaeon]